MGFPIINPITYKTNSKKPKKKCRSCNGKGYLGQKSWLGNLICPKCNGSGFLN